MATPSGIVNLATGGQEVDHLGLPVRRKSSFGAGVENLEALGRRAAGVGARLLGADDFAQGQVQKAEEAEARAAALTPEGTQISDIKTDEGIVPFVTSLGRVAGGQIAQQGPTFLAQAAGALLTRGAARGLGAGTKASNVAAGVGAGGVAAGMNVGEVSKELSDLKRGEGDEETRFTQRQQDLSSLMGGLLSGSVEGIVGAEANLFKSKGGKSMLKSMQDAVKKDTLRPGRIAGALLKGSAREGAAEASNQATILAVKTWAQNNAEFLTPENLAAIRDAGLTGVITGGPMTAASQAVGDVAQALGAPSPEAEVGRQRATDPSQRTSQQRLEDRMSQFDIEDEFGPVDADLDFELVNRGFDSRDRDAKALGRRKLRMENLVKSYLDDPSQPPEGIDPQDFNEMIVPLIEDIARGERIPNQEVIEEQLVAYFPKYEQLLRDVRQITNPREAQREVLPEEPDTVEDPDTGEQIELGRGGVEVRNSTVVGERVYGSKNDGLPFMSDKLRGVLRGSPVEQTSSLNRRVQKLNSTDNTTAHRVVPYTEALAQQLSEEGLDGDGFDTEFKRRAGLVVEDVIVNSSNPERVRQTFEETYNGNPIRFLREGFEVHEQSPRPTEQDALDNKGLVSFSPDQLKRIVKPFKEFSDVETDQFAAMERQIARAPARQRPQLKAQLGAARGAAQGETKGNEIAALDPDGKRVAINPQQVISRAFDVLPRLRTAQGDLRSKRESMAQALSEGLTTLVDQGFEIDLANIPPNTSVFRSKDTGEAVTFGELMDTAPMRAAASRFARAHRARQTLPDAIRTKRAKMEEHRKLGNNAQADRLADQLAKAEKRRQNIGVSIEESGAAHAFMQMRDTNARILAIEARMAQLEDSTQGAIKDDRMRRNQLLIDESKRLAAAGDTEGAINLTSQIVDTAFDPHAEQYLDALKEDYFALIDDLRKAVGAYVKVAPGMSKADRNRRLGLLKNRSLRDMRNDLNLDRRSVDTDPTLEPESRFVQIHRLPEKLNDIEHREALAEQGLKDIKADPNMGETELREIYETTVGTLGIRNGRFKRALVQAHLAQTDIKGYEALWQNVRNGNRSAMTEEQILSSLATARTKLADAQELLVQVKDERELIKDRGNVIAALESFLNTGVTAERNEAYRESRSARAPVLEEEDVNTERGQREETLGGGATATTFWPAEAADVNAAVASRRRAIGDPDTFAGLQTFDEVVGRAQTIQNNAKRDELKAAEIARDLMGKGMPMKFALKVARAQARELGMQSPPAEPTQTAAQKLAKEEAVRPQEELIAEYNSVLEEAREALRAQEAKLAPDQLAREQAFVNDMGQNLNPAIARMFKDEDGNPVYAGVDRIEMLTADKLMDLYGTGGRITEAGLKRLKAYRDGDMRGTAFPRSWSPNGDRLYIFVSPFLTDNSRTETLAHEFGHHVHNEIWKQIPEKERNGIQTEYDTWRAEQRRRNVSNTELFRQRKAPLTADIFEKTQDPQRLSEMDADTREYALSFNEWFADNVANWVLSDAKPQSRVDMFFKNLANLFKMLYRMAFAKGQSVPNTKVKEWLDGLWSDNNRYREMDAHARKLEEAQAALDDYQVEQGPSIDELNALFDDPDFETVPGRKKPDDVPPRDGVGKDLVRLVAVSGTPGSKGFHAHMVGVLRSGTLTQEEVRALGRAFSSPFVMNQLQKIYKDDPLVLTRLNEPGLAGLETIAFGYEQWAQGNLNLGPKAESGFQKLQQAIRGSLGVMSTSEAVEPLLTAIRNDLAADRAAGREGFKYSDRVTRNSIQHFARAFESAWDSMKPMVGAVFYTADGIMRDTGNPALINLADQFHSAVGRTGIGETMHSARQRKIGEYAGRVNRIIDSMRDEGVKAATLEALQNPSDTGLISDPEVEHRVNQIRDVLDDMFDYMQEAGVSMRQIGGRQYFPWVFNTDVLAERKDEFIDLLSQEKFDDFLQVNQKEDQAPEGGLGVNGKDRDDVPTDPAERRRYVAELYWRQLMMHTQGYADVNLDNVSFDPRMNAMNERSLDFIRRAGNEADSALLAEFLNKDLAGTMQTYVNQGVKRAEYTRRFGLGFIDEGGKRRTKLDEVLAEAEATGATPQEIDAARKYVAAQMGTLGSDINPALHRTMSGLMVYQNIRVLALSTLTSLADPLGILARTGDFGIAYQAFREGINEAMANARGEGPGELTRLAEDLGAIERGMVNEALGWEYGGAFMTGRSKKLNEAFFKAIGLTGWTNTTRLMAVRAGTAFMRKHMRTIEMGPEIAGQQRYEQSQRFLAELGLREGDLSHLLFDENDASLGTLLHEEIASKSKERDAVNTPDERKQALDDELKRDARIKTALNRFVDQSILRPDAAQRPVWASDPHWMLLFHLKSFMYSFHKTIIARALNEATEHGNLAPAAWTLSFIPAMMALDAVREGIKGAFDDEEERDRKARREPDFWSDLWVATQRSGLTGVNQIWLDALEDAQYGRLPGESFLGPTINQGTRMARAAWDGGDKLDQEMLRMLPLQTVLRPWLQAWGDDAN